MSDSLPERPDLDQLRRQAKELRDGARRGDPGAVERFVRHHGSAPQGAVTLAAAQLVLARELGFASWARLKAAVEVQATGPERQAEAFVAASIEGRLHAAAAILENAPDIASYCLEVAAVLGDSEQVRQRLAVEPAVAVAIDEVRGWPPLLYACYSHWHRIDPGRAVGIAEVVRLLLDAGANPNTNNGARPHHGYRSALHGSVMVNYPGITRLLLERGANPNDGESIYQAAGHRDHECVDLLLAQGATIAGTWALEVAVHADDARCVTHLLDAQGQHDGRVGELATSVLPDAATNASPAVVVALLDRGADPNARDSDGTSPLRRAVRAGKADSVSALMDRGASDHVTEIDRFVGACIQGDRKHAEEILVEQPGLRDRLSEEDWAVIVEAAASAQTAAVAMMLDLGFSPHARNTMGETPLHSAAYAGQSDSVALLLQAGAEIDARDANFDGTSLAFATVGSGERSGQPGNWIEVVRLLIDAGASRDGVWVSGKPPSEDVIDLLVSYGISPDDEPELEGENADDLPRSIGTGVMPDIARHLEAAYRSLDLELLGSLLHPDVRWSGQCSTRAEVLDWYRSLMAGGTRATVESVEVDRDAVVMGIRVAGQADGARQAAAELVFQVFTVANDEIVEIRGYPDRPSALARTRS